MQRNTTPQMIAATLQEESCIISELYFLDHRLFVLLFFTPASALPVSTRGYIEARFSYADFEASPEQFTERFRSTSKWYLSDSLKIELTPQVSWTQGRYELGEYINLLEDPLERELGRSFDQIAEECSWEVERERTHNELSDVLDFPRLFLDLQTDIFDLRFGKQSLNWGVGQFFNPTNVLAENLLATPWQERAGLYALKTIVPLPRTQELRFIASAEDPSLADIFLTGIYQRNIHNIDISIISSSNFEQTMIGTNIKGDAKIGYWLETAYSFSDSISEGTVEISTGADYSFSVFDGLLLSTQFSYDSSGEVDPKYYDWRARQPMEFFFPYCDTYPSLYQAPPSEARITLGRFYNLSSLRLLWNASWSTDIYALFNLHDHTGLFYPNAKFVLGSHWQWNTGVQFLIGKEGEFAPNIDSLLLPTDELIPRWTSISWLRYSF